MLTVDEFKDRTTMPSSYVDEIERQRPGWLDAQIKLVSSKVNSRLWKRYSVPFSAPVPEVVLGWLADIVTLRCWVKRGFDPGTADMQPVLDAAAQAEKDLAEAADGNVGKFELPLRQDNQTNATKRQGPRAYSEASPYVWATSQEETGRGEDENEGGSFYR